MSNSKRRTRWSLERRILSMHGVPSLSKKAWDTRQKKLGIPLACDVLEMHEIVFLERFKALGNHFEWIPKATDGTPTNDFLWVERYAEFELKSMETLKYSSASDRIKRATEKAARKGVIKDSFIIDYGEFAAPEKLLRQLKKYNRVHRENIQQLFIFDSSGLKKIELE